MNNKKLYVISALASAALLLALSLPASAEMPATGMKDSMKGDMMASGTKSTIMMKEGMRMASSTAASTLESNAKTKADSQIKERVAALTKLQSRIDQMQKVNSNDKASLDATIQTAITEMTALQAKIDADTDAATLKADIQSITKSYRIYVLVMPQGEITAAADRILTIVDLLNQLSAKIQSRVNGMQVSADVTASLSDMNAKIADASAQAQAAVSEIAALQPDNGDKTVFASNQAALKDARGKIKTATADLQAARKDAGSIVKSVTSMQPMTSTTTPTSEINHAPEMDNNAATGQMVNH